MMGGSPSSNPAVHDRTQRGLPPTVEDTDVLARVAAIVVRDDRSVLRRRAGPRSAGRAETPTHEAGGGGNR